MGVVTALEASAFLSDPGKRERNVARAFGSLFGGLFAGLFVALLCGVVALLVFVAADGDLKGGIAAAPSAIMSLLHDDGRTVQSALFILVLAVFTNGPLALTFLAVSSALSGRPLLTYVAWPSAPRWRLLVVGLALGMVWLAILLTVDSFATGKAPTPPLLSISAGWGGRSTYALSAIALLIPAAAAEELLFRGWMLRQTGVFTRNAWVLMVVNGLVFSAIHGDFSLDAFLTRAIMGAGFVYMTLRLRGIEFSTGVHAANNIMIVLFIQPLTLKTVATPDVSAGSILEDAMLIVGYVAMTELVARWSVLRRLSGLGPPEQDLATARVAQQFN